MSAVEEDSTAFRGAEPPLSGTPFQGLGRFRTFGNSGPMYEVLSVGDRSVQVFLFNSGERADYRLDRALLDPVAG